MAYSLLAARLASPPRPRKGRGFRGVSPKRTTAARVLALVGPGPITTADAAQRLGLPPNQAGVALLRAHYEARQGAWVRPLRSGAMLARYVRTYGRTALGTDLVEEQPEPVATPEEPTADDLRLPELPEEPTAESSTTPELEPEPVATPEEVQPDPAPAEKRRGATRRERRDVLVVHGPVVDLVPAEKPPAPKKRGRGRPKKQPGDQIGRTPKDEVGGCVLGDNGEYLVLRADGTRQATTSRDYVSDIRKRERAKAGL